MRYVEEWLLGAQLQGVSNAGDVATCYIASALRGTLLLNLLLNKLNIELFVMLNLRS